MVGSHDRACIQRKGRPGKSSGTWLIFITLGSCGKSEASQFLIATRGSSSHALETSLCEPPLCNHTGPQASKNDVIRGETLKGLQRKDGLKFCPVISSLLLLYFGVVLYNSANGEAK